MFIFGKTAWDMWHRLNETLFTSIRERCYISGYRKTAFTISSECGRWGKLPVTFEDIGYKPRKFEQLKDFYYPTEGVGTLMAKMAASHGKIVSLALDMLGPKKKEDIIVATKGPCIKSLIFNIAKGRTVGVHAYYRTTEVTKKFLADLLFLDWVFTRVFGDGNIADLHVMFHFASAYCHVKQFPLIDVLLKERWPKWKWLDEDRETKIQTYLTHLREGHLSSYGMVKNTERWYLRKENLQCIDQALQET